MSFQFTINEKYLEKKTDGVTLRYIKNSQLSRTWKNRYRPILPGLFYIELIVEKLS